MSCSRTGTSICSRSGSSRTVTRFPPSPVSSHAGGVRSRTSTLWRTMIMLVRLGPQRHDVALAEAVGGDVDPPAVHVDVAVAHELAGLGRVAAHPAADDVVEAQLEERSMSSPVTPGRRLASS